MSTERGGAGGACVVYSHLNPPPPVVPEICECALCGKKEQGEFVEAGRESFWRPPEWTGSGLYSYVLLCAECSREREYFHAAHAVWTDGFNRAAKDVMECAQRDYCARNPEPVAPWEKK